MSKEMGSYLSHLKQESIEKGKKALNFSTRAATPTLVIGGTLAILGGATLLGIHGQADKEFSTRVKIEIAATLLSLVIFTAPFVYNRKKNNAKRRGGIAHFTEPTDP